MCSVYVERNVVVHGIAFVLARTAEWQLFAIFYLLRCLYELSMVACYILSNLQHVEVFTMLR